MLTDYHVHLRPDGPDTPPERLLHARQRRGATAPPPTERGIAELGVSEHIYRFTRGARRSGTTRSGASSPTTTSTRTAASSARRPTCASASRPTSSPAARTASRASWTRASGTTSSARSTSSATARSTTRTTTSGAWASASTRSGRRYFTWLGEMARTGLYDILAHPDLVKHWGRQRPMPEGDLRRYYELAMDGIAESGIAIEVSTAGLRKPVGELYPDRAVPGDVPRRRLPGRALERRPPRRAPRLRLRHGARAARRHSASPSSPSSRAASGAWSRSGPLTVPAGMMAA